MKKAVSPLMELEHLLSEPVDAAMERAKTAFDQAASRYGNRFVLFGAGNMGRRVLACLRQDNIAPLAFADNQESNWDKTIDGLTVLCPSDAARRFGREATFIVTIYNNTHNYLETRKQLLQLGCGNVVSVVPVRWKYHEAFLPYFHDDLPHKVLLESRAIREVFALWSDDESRREYVAQIAWRLHAQSSELSVPLWDQQYFPLGLFALTPDEVFVDVGAYDGDTLRKFLALRGDSFRQVLALEPDAENYRRLAAFWSTLPRILQRKIELQPLAVGRQLCKLRFASGEGTSSAVSAHGSTAVKCVRLDDLLAESRPTYIKMDIEGAELDAIAGCRRVLREDRPLIAACVYHVLDHLWMIPKAIHQLLPECQLFLRPHAAECWETVCYGVPVERLTHPKVLQNGEIR